MKFFLPVSPIRRLFLLLALLWPAIGHAQGTVVAWGFDAQGQTDVPYGLANVVDVDVGLYHTLALKSNGTIVAWGGNENGQATAPSGNDFIAISAGYFHNVALRADGSVIAWGDNSEGQTTLPEGLTDIVAVAAGGVHTLLLKSDGTVMVVGGQPSYGTDQIPAGLDDVIAIAANFYQSMALTADGKVHAWGVNLFGESTVPADLEDVIAIDAGAVFSLALKADGTVVVMGDAYNSWGLHDIPAGLTDAMAVAAGYSHALALRADGSIVGWGDACNGCQDHGATTIPSGLVGVTDIGAGQSFGVAVLGLPTDPQPLTHTYLGTITGGVGPQAGELPVGSNIIVSTTANAAAVDLNPDPRQGEYEDGVLSLRAEVPSEDFSTRAGPGFLIVGNDYGLQNETDAVQYYGDHAVGTLGGFPVTFLALTFLEVVPAGSTPTMIDSDAVPTTPIESGSVNLDVIANNEYNSFGLDVGPVPAVAEAVDDAAARIRELVASHRLNAGVGKSLLTRLAAVLAASQVPRNSACGLYTGLSKQVAHLPRRSPDQIAVGTELDALLLVVGAALGGC